MLIFTSTNITVRCKGSVKPIPTKIHRNKTVSTDGSEAQTFVRGKTNYDVTVTEMSEGNYEKMLDMFILSGENDFGFIDTERNFDGQHYFLDMDEFSLNEIENKKEKGYYFVGTFRITKY